MAQSLVRSIVAAAIVWSAYVAYSMVAVPLIEPEIAPKPIDSHAAIGSSNTQRSSDRQMLLAELFPAGSWPLKHPKMVETDQAILMFEEYKNQADGTVSMWPCAMIFFPGGKEAEDAAGDAVVLDAPDGATLRFDKPFDLGRSSVGRLEAGRLLGEIKIYSRQDPGPHDDLMITTREVQLAPESIWTPHAVNFRMGASYGSGKELRIHLTPRQDGTPQRRGPSVGGVRSIELAHEVKVHLDLGRRQIMPTERPASDLVAVDSNQTTNDSRSRPIEVTCTGPFQYDVLSRIATFNEQVNVLQIHENGQSDQLLGEVLSLYFAPRDETRKESSSRLTLASVEAQGRPVIVHSPSTATEARCQTLRFDVDENRLRLAGQSGVWLKREASEVKAGSIDYVAAKQGRLGQLLATGPGRIDAMLGDKQDQPFSAEWSDRLQIQPQDGRKVISLVGNARSSSRQWGSLAASAVHVYVSEVERATTTPGRATRSRIEIRPDAFLATGQVQIDSPQLVGSTEDLELWIEHVPPAVDNPRQPKPPAERNAFDPRGDTDSEKPKDRYKIHGGKIQVQLAARPRGKDGDRQITIAHAVVTNQAYLAEVPLPGDARAQQERPLLVRGDELRVEQANAPDMTIRVAGRPAHIEARGMSLDGHVIDMNRITNEVRIDRAGQLSLPVNRDLDGQTLGTRDRLTITWAGGMTFDGLVMRFRDDVTAATSHQSLATQAMDVTMTQRVDFARSESRRDVNVHAVACEGEVRLQAETLDQKGNRESWLRAVADNLAIVQTTGKITADGPGWIKIVRRGTVDTSSIGLGGTPNRSTAVSDRLSYLGVDFQRGLTGNILPRRRQLVFSDQVKTVFGPVERWADELDTARRTPDRPDNVLLNCDRLTVSQTPTSAGAPAAFDLAAEGSTRVDGKGFAAMASRLSFAQSKDLLILDSDGLSDAKLFRDDERGGRSELAARQIHYWPRSQKFRVFGARSVNSVSSGR